MRCFSMRLYGRSGYSRCEQSGRQAYAVLTLCRALRYSMDGRSVSKRQDRLAPTTGSASRTSTFAE